MQISSNMQTMASMQSATVSGTFFTQKLTKEDVYGLREQIDKNSYAFTFEYSYIQINVMSPEDKFVQDYQDFQTFLGDIGYTGKPIAELSQDEAAEIVSEDGIFGVKQTSERIANFIINGAGGDEDMLRAGREGMLRGFKEAQEIWGGELPEISQTSMQKAIEMVDKAMTDLGYSIIDEEV